MDSDLFSHFDQIPVEPEKVLELFRQTYSKEDCLHELWQLFTVTVSGNFNELNTASRENLCIFFKDLHYYMIAAYTCGNRHSEAFNKQEEAHHV